MQNSTGPNRTPRTGATPSATRLSTAGGTLAVTLVAALAWAGGSQKQRPDTVPVLSPNEAPAAARQAAPPAQAAAQPTPAPTREQAEADSLRMMEAWHKKHPERHWERTPAHAAKLSPEPGHQQQQTYGNYTDRDEQIWQASLDSFVARGKAVFHDAGLLGSTTAISCDMCHPDGANTHPETYPKFQVQLGRVAMLRDMINWCLQNPARAKPMADDDEKLKAMEAYLTFQRGGHPLEPGRH